MDIITAFEAVVGGSNPSGCISAPMAELVDALVSETSDRKVIEVRILLGAQIGRKTGDKAGDGVDKRRL
jgi:hypothetical protein